MHRSRLGVVLIDHPGPSFEAALAFWAAATGREVKRDEGSEYASLGDLSSVELVVQRMDGTDPVRTHLDFETDDVAAESARLEALGARRELDHEEGHVIMSDPGGQLFCVVPQEGPADEPRAGAEAEQSFSAQAVVWD